MRIEFVSLDDRLRQRPARALGDEDILSKKADARLESVSGLSVAADAEDARHHAFDAAVAFVPQHLACRHPWIDLNTQGLGFFAQPADDIAKRDHMAAFVVHE